MKIMFIVPRISGGGAEKVITALASQVAEKHEVILVTTIQPDGKETYPVSEKVIQRNLWEEIRNTQNQKPEQTKKERHQKKRRLSRVEKKALRAARRCSEKLASIGQKGKKLRSRYLPGLERKLKNRQNRQAQIRTLERLKREYGIDCAISFLNSANDLNVSAAAGKPAIISIRSCLEGPFAPPESQTLRGRQRIIRSCRKADRIVAVSDETAESLRRSFRAGTDRVSTIYNYCDTDQIRTLAGDGEVDEGTLRRIQEAEFVFFSSGRLTRKKGQWHLVRAFRRVVDRHPGALLIILGREGKGTENTGDLLKETIKAKHLENNVILAGFHINPYAYLAKGDAYVMSSFNEGFPNALVEAMALSLPVVSTDCRSGPREILAPGTDCLAKTKTIEYAEYGILVPECSGATEQSAELEESEKQMAEAMLLLMEDPGKREYYSRKSRERAEQFTKTEILARWEQLIEDVCH